MNLETGEIWNAMKDVKYRRTMQTLAKVISEANGDFDAALVVALDKVAEAVHAEAGTLWFYDRNGDGLIHPKAVYGGGDLSNVYLLPGEGIAGKVIQESKSDIIADCQKDSRWQNKTDSKTGFTTKSMICVPLIAQGYTFGCIQIINKTDDLLFDETDLNFVENLSQTASNCFVAQNLLTDCLASKNKSHCISFDEVFLCKDIFNVEFNLRSMEQFAKLTVKDQERVLEYAHGIWEIFHSKNH